MGDARLLNRLPLGDVKKKKEKRKHRQKSWDKRKADLNHASEQVQDMLDAELP